MHCVKDIKWMLKQSKNVLLFSKHHITVTIKLFTDKITQKPKSYC